MVPIGILGLLLSGAALPLSEVVPIGEKRSAQILGQMNIDRQWRNNFVFRTDDGGALVVQRLTLTDDRMTGITLMTPMEGGSTRYLMADEAYFSETHGWTFHNGYVREVHPDRPDVATAYDSLRTTTFQERPQGLIDQVSGKEEQMTRAELAHLAGNIERSGGDSQRLRLEMQQRVSLAFTSFVIVLFGGPLATSSRRGGNAYGIGIALGTTMLYILLMRLSGLAIALARIDEALSAGGKLGDVLDEQYPELEKISIDFAVMEKARNVVTIESGFDWDDVGEWPAVARHFEPDASGNVIRGGARVQDGSDNIVISSGGHLVALVGVDDLIVVRTEDATLVCPKAKAQDIKKLVKELGYDPKWQHLT